MRRVVAMVFSSMMLSSTKRNVRKRNRNGQLEPVLSFIIDNRLSHGASLASRKRRLAAAMKSFGIAIRKGGFPRVPVKLVPHEGFLKEDYRQ